MLTIVTSLLNTMCSVRVFEAFRMIYIWCALILGQLARGWVGWMEGKGERWVNFLTSCLEKPPKRTPETKKVSSEQFQDMATQLVPSIGAILLTMTSQGQQNALQKSRLTHIG